MRRYGYQLLAEFVIVMPSDPTSTNDVDHGFGVGQTWINSETQDVWTCVVQTPGAAVWSNLSSGGGGGGTPSSTVAAITGTSTAGSSSNYSRGDHAHGIAAGAVQLTNLANQATNTIIGNVSGISSSPSALTGSQVSTLLGLGSAAFVASSSFLTPANNLSDVGSASVSRTNLGLGSAAVLSVGTTSGTVAAGDDSRIVGAVQSTSLGAANGVATLNGSGKLTSSQIPSSLIGAVVYQGTWNASTNTPTLTSGVGTQGFYYIVSVAGTTTLDGISVWDVGDTAIFNGTTWDKIEGQGGVETVNGYQGPTVVLAYTDVGADASGAAAAVLATSLQKANNLSDITSASSARASLGLGTAATFSSGAFAQTANNLSDLASASSARTNLGLGTASTFSSSAFAQTANNLSDLASVATARSNIGVDQLTRVADANHVCASSDHIVAWSSITAARTATLPAANSVNAGSKILLIDASGSVSQSVTITISGNGTDNVDKSTTTTVVISSPFGFVEFFSDGVSNWTSDDASVNVQVFTTSGTWTKPPWAAVVDVLIIAPGGPGSSGAAYSGSGATGTTGGSGGGSGGTTRRSIPTATLTSTVTVTVPSAPTGGASVSVSAGGGTVTGNAGSAAVTVSFGSYATATSGSPGASYTAAGAAGFGTFAGVAGAAGAPGTQATQPTTNAEAPGAGGGGSGTQGNGAATTTSGSGGNTPRSAGATGGGLGTSTGVGGTAGVGLSQTAGSGLPGAGGGGGNTGSAGLPPSGGGAGGAYGGGGGGGGSYMDASGLTAGSSGAGGNGGPGIVLAISR